MYIVIALVDNPDGLAADQYVAATHTLFTTADAAAKYAARVAVRRKPRVVTPAEYLRECRMWRTK